MVVGIVPGEGNGVPKHGVDVPEYCVQFPKWSQPPSTDGQSESKDVFCAPNVARFGRIGTGVVLDRETETAPGVPSVDEEDLSLSDPLRQKLRVRRA
jgi:hypothetical protein